MLSILIDERLFSENMTLIVRRVCAIIVMTIEKDMVKVVIVSPYSMI